MSVSELLGAPYAEMKRDAMKAFAFHELAKVHNKAGEYGSELARHKAAHVHAQAALAHVSRGLGVNNSIWMDALVQVRRTLNE